MALPLSRDFDAVDAGPLPHTTVNALQDAIVEGKHGERVLRLGSSAGESSPSGNGWQYLPSQGAVANAYVVPASINSIVAFALPLHEGDRVSEINGYIQDTAGANDVTMELRRSRSDATNVQVGATQTSAGDGSLQTLTITGLASVIAATDFYTVTFQNQTASAGSHKCFGIDVTYDHP